MNNSDIYYSIDNNIRGNKIIFIDEIYNYLDRTWEVNLCQIK